MSIYLTSDLHLNHNKEFLYGNRGFASVADHDQAVIQRINEVVSPEDDLYILGDLCLGSDLDYASELLSQIDCRIHIALGNHDLEPRVDMYLDLENVVEIALAYSFKYNKQMVYLSHYPTITSNYDFEKPLNHRVIGFCGHTHTTDPFKDFGIGLIYHIELDAHDCRPISLDDAIDAVKEKYYANH